MNCASCGKDNVDDARFCVHCGARQSEPTPIAAVAAAAMSRGAAGRTQAANAAHADSGVSAASELRGAARAARATPAAWSSSEAGESVERAAGDAGPASSSPAHGASPRVGLVAVLIGGFILAGIVVFAGWHVLHDGAEADIAGDKAAGDTSIMSAFPPENTPHRTASPAAIAPPSLPVTPAAESAPNPERTGPGEAAPQADAAASPRGGIAGPASGRTPSVEIRALPARPAHAAGSPRAPVERKKAPPAPPAAVEPAPARAAAPPAPVAAPSPPPDRWARMKDDLSRCTREDFIARVVCDQRTRWRYCDGYWGKVVECPANPTTPERGQ